MKAKQKSLVLGKCATYSRGENITGTGQRLSGTQELSTETNPFCEGDTCMWTELYQKPVSDSRQSTTTESALP